MEDQQGEIDRVIDKRKEKAEKSEKEREEVLSKKNDGKDSTNVQNVSLEVSDVDLKSKSLKKILANYSKWNPNDADGIVLGTKLNFNTGRGAIILKPETTLDSIVNDTTDIKEMP